jgi:NADH dehydrogenase FAD-containing subunit
VIDQSDRFVFKPLLYELLSGAASEEEVAPPFAQLLGPYPVTFLQGRVASVEPEHATQVRAGRVDSRTAADSGAGSAGRLAGSSRG